MKLTKLENTGRYFCQLYFSGVLKPSVFYQRGTRIFSISRCVETSLEDASGKKGKTGSALRMLMSGDLTKLRNHERDGLLGGRAILDEEDGRSSIDGGCLCVAEVGMYAEVGKNFMSLLK